MLGLSHIAGVPVEEAALAVVPAAAAFAGAALVRFRGRFGRGTSASGRPGPGASPKGSLRI
jgi:hypothetical protein